MQTPSFFLPERLLSGQESPRPISMLWEQTTAAAATREGERQLMAFVLPPWQRGVVWGEERQRAFIEGILLGFPPGVIVTVEADWLADNRPTLGSGWLIDGQQRVTSIREFVEDRLTVFGGVRYSDLSKLDRIRRFDRVPFPQIILPANTDEAVLKALYFRMNYGGVAHTPEDLARLDFDGEETSTASFRP